MFGFIVGTACLIGLVKMVRGGCGYARLCGGPRACGFDACEPGGRYGWRGHGGCATGCRGGGGGGFGPPWMFRRYLLRSLFERLDTTPGQEKVIVAAVDEVQEAVKAARGEFKRSREDVARAVGGDAFDETVIGGVFARHDEALANVRRAATGALARVHDALDARQRARLAEIIAEGPWAFRRYGGPYRG